MGLYSWKEKLAFGTFGFLAVVLYLIVWLLAIAVPVVVIVLVLRWMDVL